MSNYSVSQIFFHIERKLVGTVGLESRYKLLLTLKHLRWLSNSELSAGNRNA